MLSDRDSMAGRKPGTERASSINNGMTSDQRARTDDGRWIFIRRLVIIGGQWLSHHAIVTNDRIVTNLNIVINGRTISNLHIPADTGILANLNISAIEFHIEILSIEGNY